MYSAGYVLAVMLGGQAAAESRHSGVSLPFGSEYVIYVKNKNDLPAVASVYIDGQNVTGGGLIVRAGEDVRLEQPVDRTGRFKFVRQDSPEAVRAGKSNPADDRNGVVEVRWRGQRRQEKLHFVPVPAPQPPVRPTMPRPRTPWRSPAPWPHDQPFQSAHLVDGDLAKSAGVMSRACSHAAADLYCNFQNRTTQADGCTVPGGHSAQDFVAGHVSDLVPEDQAVVMRLFLHGFEPEVCPFCKSKIDRGDNYCSSCGALLR